jgi:PPP family 3-phenylpropionic acid transporter
MERIAGGEVRRLDRDIRVLYTLGGIATAALLPFFSVLLDERGFTADRIGLILSLEALAAVIAAPFWSHEADTRLGGARALILSSVLTVAFALLLIPTGDTLWAVALAAMGMAAASAPGTALGDALALSTLGAERATDFGLIRRFASGGWAIAVVAFGLLYQHVGFGPLLPSFAILTTVYGLFVLRFPEGRPVVAEVRPSRFGAIGAAFRSSPRLLPFLGGLLLLSCATSSTDGFVPLRMLGAGGGPFLIGIAAGAAAVIEIPIFTGSARLGARFGMRNLFLAGVAISIVALVGYALADRPSAVAVIRGAMGAAFGLKYAALVVLTDRLVPRHLRNTGQALMQMASWAIGPVIGPVIGGTCTSTSGRRRCSPVPRCSPAAAPSSRGGRSGA